MRSDDFFDAKRAGAEIIVVDPHFSTTASKANQWIPLKPGTDGALYLSMISHIIDNQMVQRGLYARPYFYAVPLGSGYRRIAA